MSSTTFTWRRGAELPGLTLPWQTDETGTVTDLDLTAGWTFTLELVDISGTVALTKTTGITGYDGGVTVAWAIGELDLAAGSYRLRLRARETATGKDRDYRPGDEIRIVISP